MISIKLTFTSIYFYSSTCMYVETMLKLSPCNDVSWSPCPLCTYNSRAISPMHLNPTMDLYMWLRLYILSNYSTAPVTSFRDYTTFTLGNSIIWSFPRTPGLWVPSTDDKSDLAIFVFKTWEQIEDFHSIIIRIKQEVNLSGEPVSQKILCF